MLVCSHLERFSDYVVDLIKSLQKLQTYDSIPGNQQAFARLSEMAEVNGGSP